MLPYERSLVKRMAGKPFAIVGVSADSDRAAYARMAAAQSVTWRSFFDGSQFGPIQTAWNVHKLPTLYLIDAAGVIRHKDIRDEELDRAIDALVAEAEKTGGPKAK
jgi:hypothetical protein